MIERLRAWSYRRQHLERTAPDPPAALERVIAVHSTHPPAPLSLLARTPGFDYPAFEALERNKQVVGIAAMRGSVHLIPAAFAPAILAATKASAAQLLKRFGNDPHDDRTFDQVRADLLPRLKEPIPGAEIRERLGLTDREFLAVRLMSRSGDVLRLSTNPRSDRLKYVSTEGWLGAPFPNIDKAEALAWLAGAYFDGFGPARIRDFAWWAGISQRVAHAAVASLSLCLLGDELMIPEARRHEFEQAEPIASDAIAILPKWDSYTMGYAPDGRQRLVDDDHVRFAYSTNETKSGATTGDGFPLILRGGRAVARWEHRFSARRMTATLLPFPGEIVEKDELLPGMREVALLMGCDTLEIEQR